MLNEASPSHTVVGQDEVSARWIGFARRPFVFCVFVVCDRVDLAGPVLAFSSAWAFKRRSFSSCVQSRQSSRKCRVPVSWCGPHRHTGAFLPAAPQPALFPFMAPDGFIVRLDCGLSSSLLFPERLFVDNAFAQRGSQSTS